MSRYDGLIIPRSYSEYINKTDSATLQQALQLSGVLSGAVAAGDNKAVKSSAVATALAGKQDTSTFLGQVASGGSIDITVPGYKAMLLHTEPYNGGALLILAVAMYTEVEYTVLINQYNSFSVTSIGNRTLRITNNHKEYPFNVKGITF